MADWIIIVDDNAADLQIAESTLTGIGIYTVGVDDLLRAVFFRHVGEAAAPFQDVCRRVVEKQNEAGILLHPLNTVSGIPLSKFSNISLTL